MPPPKRAGTRGNFAAKSKLARRFVTLGRPRACVDCTRRPTQGRGQGIGDLVVDVLLLEHLLFRELDLAVKVLKSCGLAKAVVVDEAILEVVKLGTSSIIAAIAIQALTVVLTIILLSGVQKLGTLINKKFRSL